MNDYKDYKNDKHGNEIDDEEEEDADENDDKIDDDDDDDAVENYDKIDDDDHADENDDQNDGAGQIRRLWQPIKAFLLAPLAGQCCLDHLEDHDYDHHHLEDRDNSDDETAMMKMISMKPIKAFLLTRHCWQVLL